MPLEEVQLSWPPPVLACNASWVHVSVVDFAAHHYHVSNFLINIQLTLACHWWQAPRSKREKTFGVSFNAEMSYCRVFACTHGISNCDRRALTNILEFA